VVTRIAHKEFFFDAGEKEIVVELLRAAEAFSCVMVIAFCVMSNHLHLLVAIDKPANLRLWESWQMFIGYDFERVKDGDLYRVGTLSTLSEQEVDDVRECESMSLFERYETTKEELVARIRGVMRKRPFDDLMKVWSNLTEDRLQEEYERFLSRMYSLSEFMKTLKQNISQYYNLRHGHTGGLWEGRFKDTIIEQTVEAMSSVATYIDLNPWRAGICAHPAEYKWSSYGNAVAGDARSRSGYNFIYDTSDGWEQVNGVYAQQLANRMAADTARQGELEEAVFTSGTAVGSEEFIRRLVGSEDEAFPTGHKTPPVNFTVGENKLKALRNLRVLRKK
jgi:REP element-mobilizing transposase RayT